MNINNIDRVVALNQQLQAAKNGFEMWKNWKGDHLCILSPLPHIVEGAALEGVRAVMMQDYSALQAALIKEIESL